MVGNMELSIKLLINGTQMSLTLSDNTNQHILLTGGKCLWYAYLYM